MLLNIYYCPVCKSSNLVEGKLRSPNEVTFLMSNRGKFTSDKPEAFACLDCGYIYLSFNSKSLKLKFRKK